MKNAFFTLVLSCVLFSAGAPVFALSTVPAGWEPAHSAGTDNSQYFSGNLEPVVNAQGAPAGYMNQVVDANGNVVDWVFLPTSQFGGAHEGQVIDTSYTWRLPQGQNAGTVSRYSSSNAVTATAALDSSGSITSWRDLTSAATNATSQTAPTSQSFSAAVFPNQAWSSLYNPNLGQQLQSPIQTAPVRGGVYGGNIQYTPLEPLPGSSGFGYGAGGQDFPQYISSTYRVLVTLGGLLAIVILAVGGVRYMLSEGFTDKEKSKKQMTSSLWGLGIVVGSFLILYTINPDLLKFNLNPPPSTIQPLTPLPSQDQWAPYKEWQDKLNKSRDGDYTREECSAASQWLTQNGGRNVAPYRASELRILINQANRRGLTPTQVAAYREEMIAVERDSLLNVSIEARCAELYK